MEPAPRHAVQHRQTTALVLAALLGLAVVAAMVTRTSQAAFTATTDNTANVFNAGTVTLTDDDAGAALFAVDGMEPGQTVTDCIVVSYDGTIATPGGVVVYGGGFTDVGGSEGLSNHLLVTLDEGDLDTPGDCATFTSSEQLLSGVALSTFNTTSSDYATGVGTWTPTATGEDRAYQLSVTLDEDTPDTEQGAGTTDVAFVWEVQN